MYIELINSSCIQNKYTNWYISICTTAKQRVVYNTTNYRRLKNQLSYYSEAHHILPQCICTDEQKTDINNIVILSAREHFVCHWLLCKMFEGETKLQMWNALSCFRQTSGNQERHLTSHQFEIARKYHALKSKNRIITDEFRQSISVRFKDVPKTEEHKQKIGISNSGKTKGISRPHTIEQNTKIGDSLRGKSKSDSHKEALRLANLGKKKPRVVCEKCGRDIGINNISKHSKACNGGNSK